ncbi:hypothetical protein OIU78_028564 [Salix suchowensis]|nr:hypothetical protein OIU78_028564 [Salix suchowensis]
MTDNLESKDIVVADEVADFGVESSEGTTGIFEFSSNPKGKDEGKEGRIETELHGIWSKGQPSGGCVICYLGWDNKTFGNSMHFNDEIVCNEECNNQVTNGFG